MRYGLLLLGSLLVLGGIARSDEMNSRDQQTIMSTNVGDQPIKDQQDQEAGTVGDGDDPRSAHSEGADGSQSQELKQKRREEQSLSISPSQRQALVPHAIMVHTELLSAKDELNGIRSQLQTVPKGAAPDQETLQHLSIYAANVNQDLKIAAAHHAELKSGVQAIPNGLQNKSFAHLDATVGGAMDANTAWQPKALTADYWKNTDTANNDVEALIKKIDSALDRDRSFSSDQLDVSYVG